MADNENFLKLRSDIGVNFVTLVGTDTSIRSVARVSTGLDLHTSDDEKQNLKKFLRFLVKNQHGSPFEHTLLQFRIEAPIFVWREFHRHRIGFSYNEQSARYMKLLPHFYYPSPERFEHCVKTDTYKVSSP